MELKYLYSPMQSHCSVYGVRKLVTQLNVDRYIIVFTLRIDGVGRLHFRSCDLLFVCAVHIVPSLSL